MTDVAAVVAAAAGSRGIGFQGKLVSSANDVIYDGIGFDVETTDGVCVGVYSWSLQYIIIIIGHDLIDVAFIILTYLLGVLYLVSFRPSAMATPR